MDEKTWGDAVDQWLKDKRHKSSLHKDREIFAWFEPHLGGCLLADIDRQKLNQIAEAKAAATSYSTANRHMALVRAVLRRACEVWEWIGRVPKVPMYPVRNARARWLTRAEADRLLSRLPPHQAAMARFGLATGLRQRNVCRLRWADVDELNHCVRLPADRVKNRKALVVPLNRDALAVLELQRGVHPEYVFTFHGNRFGRSIRRPGTRRW